MIQKKPIILGTTSVRYNLHIIYIQIRLEYLSGIRERGRFRRFSTGVNCEYDRFLLKFRWIQQSLLFQGTVGHMYPKILEFRTQYSPK